ncbi:hypothetical protein KEM52_003217 [Ascosphaera acerosa]|nr:hypothetical protein KEM52_003217 [Ascosphaera acerosa]
MASRRAKHALARAISPPPLKRAKQEQVIQMAQGTATTQSQTVSTFLKPASRKRTGSHRHGQARPRRHGQVAWRIINQTCLLGRYGATGSDTTVTKAEDDSTAKCTSETGTAPTTQRIAAFDLDGTLVKTKSGARFPINGDDWTWLAANVPARLHELHCQGYLLAIVTNQKAVSLRKQVVAGKPDSKSTTNLKRRLAGVMATLDLPMLAVAATEDDDYRKPSRGMWGVLVGPDGFNAAEGLDAAQCLFVGDAAGRAGDHSAVDRDFAANAAIPFMTPEEMFLGQRILQDALGGESASAVKEVSTTAAATTVQKQVSTRRRSTRRVAARAESGHLAANLT